jgi:hypothetical protein
MVKAGSRLKDTPTLPPSSSSPTFQVTTEHSLHH